MTGIGLPRLGVAGAVMACITIACFSGSPLTAEQKLPQVAPIGATAEGKKFYPRWRGPSGQGVVERGGYPDLWSETKNVLWAVELPGAGNSSPIIWADRIFLTTAYERGKRRSIICLHRIHRRRLWQTFAPEAVPERSSGKNGHATSTPSTDGERVYAYLGNHGLLCVDFTGRQIWHRSLGEISTRHGTAGSPLLYRDRIIIFQDGTIREGDTKTGGFVAAFDKLTGRTLWRTPRKERVGWGSPVAVRVGDHDEIIVSSQRKVYAYDPETGKELWYFSGNLSEVTPTPVIGHGLLFCCSGRAGPTLAIRPGGSGDVTDTHLAWRANKGSPFVPSPLLYGDYLYMINDMNGVVTCYRAQSGELQWQQRLGAGKGGGFSASPVGVDGKVFFTSERGDTYVLEAGAQFKLLRVNSLGERMLASPALCDGKWYFRTARRLVCVASSAAE